ncbi:hypothetical protein [Bradyrhizobium sp. CCGUVB23]|uniref:hypothetical protein n=1 Tax=Bradyrhizobium sp. CCGUVB23 TaxID=2949630 RepID=UPI003532183A
MTLRDAGEHIAALPKNVHDAPEWQVAMEALILMAERGGPTMFAWIGIMRALNRRKPLPVQDHVARKQRLIGLSGDSLRLRRHADGPGYCRSSYRSHRGSPCLTVVISWKLFFGSQCNSAYSDKYGYATRQQIFTPAGTSRGYPRIVYMQTLLRPASDLLGVSVVPWA